MIRKISWVLLLALGLNAGSSLAAQTIGAVPGSVRAEFGISSVWYAKYVDADGIPVLGSAQVSDAALLKARANAIVLMRTAPRSVAATLRSQRNRIVILGLSETVRDIPEYAAAFPSSDADAGYWGGFGATKSLPITSGTEDNLLRNRNLENVFIHEFGHTIAELGLAVSDPEFQSQLQSHSTGHAKRACGTAPMRHPARRKYWAEGVQSYFDVNREGPSGGDGVHNGVNTRSELEGYDRALFNLLNRVYGAVRL